jgi:UDP-N-acetylmuramoyl-tripeptide--D-alanyl-D-alanine ligase
LMHASLSELISLIPSAHITAPTSFVGVSTNSKKVDKDNLFIALRGERFDAHDFLGDVVAQGAAAVVVDRVPNNLNVPALVVPDTRYALGQIAHYWRQKFSIPVIGVTGSNGKTTVKEMIASILSAAFGEKNYLSTLGNLNNEIGVPLTLFRLENSHRAAVIEMGMNHPGEIARLAEIAQPTVGLVNNAQREHQEFMESVAAVAKENGAVINALPIGGCAVFPADDDYASLWQTYADKRQTMTFGLDKRAQLWCEWMPKAFGSDLHVHINGQIISISLAAAGEHNVRNALAAFAATHAVGIDMTSIVNGLQAFVPVAGRLQRKSAPNGALVIDDTYNANPDSVRAAIDVLATAPSPRTLVLGDMGEVGSEGVAFHEEIGSYARTRHIDRLFTLGSLARHASLAFGSAGRHFDDVDTLNNELGSASVGASILVKGSRFMKMERVVERLTGTSVGGH